MGLTLGSPEFVPFSQKANQLKEDERNFSVKSKREHVFFNEELAIIKRPKKHFTNHKEREEFVKHY